MFAFVTTAQLSWHVQIFVVISAKINFIDFIEYIFSGDNMSRNGIVPFHKDFSPSGKQLEHRKSAHEL